MGANFYLDELLCGGSLAGGTTSRRRAQAGTSYMYDAAAGAGAGDGARLGSYEYGSDQVQPEGSGAGSASGLGLEEHPICALTGWLSLVGMFLYLVSFGLGMSPIPWALNAELYPLGVRSICVSIATATNWISNFVVSATFLSLEDLFGPARTFWLYGTVAAAGFVWLYFTMPETAGKSLEEVEQLFVGHRRPGRGER
jgi:amino acid transporter